MKLFNIINESKSFILILLFTFTLAITSQSFASSKNTPDDLAKLCAPDDLTTLNDDDKEKCVGWCKIETNWVAKCAKIGVEKPVDGTAGETNGVAGEKVDITLKTRIIKELKGLDDVATGLKVPDIYNNIYSFKIKLDKSLRPTLFEHMKPKKPSKDPDEIDIDAIDKTVVSNIMKAIILDGLGYSDLKADGTNNDDKLEKLFIDFRNNWLQLEAKGSTTDTNVAFEPSAFKALASENHANQGPMHQIYNILEEDKKVFSNAKYDEVIANAADVATDLKNLRDAIVTFVKNKLIVAGPDIWLPESDLEFNIKLGKFSSSLDGLDAETFDITKKADFDKIKDYFTPMDFYTSDTVFLNHIKSTASNGLLILIGGDLNYELNPEKVEAGVEGNKNFTEDEKNTQDYKIYATRFKRFKAFEAGLKKRFASGVDYATPEDGSLLHKLTECVRDTSDPAFENLAFTLVVSDDLVNVTLNGFFSPDKVIHKVGFVGGKWVLLIYAAPGNARKTLIQFITEPPALGNPPRFTVQAPSTYISANFWGPGPGNNPEHHTFDALSGNGLALGTNLFAQEKLLPGDIVRTPNNARLHDAVASNASDLKLIKFRVMNTHGIATRTQNGTYNFILAALRLFKSYFITDNTFGTDTDKVFSDLTKFNPALGQLYAFNQFTRQVDRANCVGNIALDLPADGNESDARHYISTHIVNPVRDDVTFVITSKFMRNR